ncbi:MAG: NADH-quinone oxidoreductase subunit J [Nitrospiraceae bacterium]|nr:MAG: NADH-quinone oxidoreductase subunit J [Nitrospiraceae bacterium]
MITVFYISAAVAVISTVMVITKLNAVHALLYLIVSLMSVAVIFFAFGAPFVAALELIIYAGAIMVLFVFVIMMLNMGARTVEEEKQLITPEIWLGPATLTLVLLAEFIYLLLDEEGKVSVINGIGPKEVGTSLLGKYLLGVELASMLLLAGLVGAYHLGRRSPQDREQGLAGRD